MSYPPEVGDDIINSDDVNDCLVDIINEIGDSESLEEFVDEREQEASLRTILEAGLNGVSPEDWNYGVALIADHYFEEYAEELAKDCGYLPDDEDNPLLVCVDWGRWADDVRQYYTEIDIEGETYWVRA